LVPERITKRATHRKKVDMPPVDTPTTTSRGLMPPEERPLLSDNVSETSSLQQPRPASAEASGEHSTEMRALESWAEGAAEDADAKQAEMQHPMLNFASQWGGQDDQVLDFHQGATPRSSEPQTRAEVGTPQQQTSAAESSSAPIREAVTTRSTQKAKRGSKVMPVANTAGFAVGDPIHIESSAGKEFNIVKGFSSIQLEHPLKHTHPKGATVRKLEHDDPLLDPLLQATTTSSAADAHSRGESRSHKSGGFFARAKNSFHNMEQSLAHKLHLDTDHQDDRQVTPSDATNTEKETPSTPSEAPSALPPPPPPKPKRKVVGQVGMYQVIAAQGAHITAEQQRTSDHVHFLAKGSFFNVAEVKWNKDELRIRGLVDKPVRGWISLAKTDRSIIWARPVQDDEDISHVVLEVEEKPAGDVVNEELQDGDPSVRSRSAALTTEPQHPAPPEQQQAEEEAHFAACRCRGSTLPIHKEKNGERKLHMRLPAPEFEVCVLVPVDESRSVSLSPKLVSADGLVAGWPGNIEPWSEWAHPQTPTALRSAREGWLRLTYPFKRTGFQTAEIPPHVEGEIKVRISFDLLHWVTLSLHFSLECSFENTVPEGIFSHEDKMVLVEHLLGENTRLDEIHEDYVEDVVKYAFVDFDEAKQQSVIAAWNRHLRW